MMNAAAPDLKDRLKARLFDSISAQIDAIGYVPDDITGIVGGAALDTGAERPVDPVAPARVAGTDGLSNRVNAYYDAAFYAREGVMGSLVGKTGYRNIGYWDERTTSQNDACERLQDALLDFIPEKKGRILDVACGLGASTRRLLDHYPPESVWAINISEKQIATTRENAPGVHASVMSATEMTFEDSFFDAILCIEAAFHFETRRKFLEDARRILKPGGRLVLSDVLFTSKERLAQYPVLPSPDNHLATPDDYRALLADIGFAEFVVNDVSKEVWGAHFLHFVTWIHEQFYEGKINVVELTDMLWTYYQLNAVTGPCVFVCAVK
jgi:ubiquinone/menaquinone biosynthesis C-methylase UbiE